MQTISYDYQYYMYQYSRDYICLLYILFDIGSRFFTEML
jgi:hypothetical protein